MSMKENEMKLWLLRPNEPMPEGKDPWDPWYDKVFGFVIRAETETKARQLAQQNAGDETALAWHNTYSTCIELTHEGISEIILIDEKMA
jgi:hypothetical protein